MNHALALTGDEPGKQYELQQTGAAASAQHEIQSAIIVAKKFPRNEVSCFQKLMLAASRPSFAEDATYDFPRGTNDDGTKKIISGPSVNLAREAARIWGNIRFGLYVVRDDDDTRLIRGWAWDVESNVKNEFDDDFKKLIQRKVKDGPNKGETRWVEPDERDLRELTNRRGAILVRNALLQVMPKDLIEDALFKCSETLEKEAGENPEAVRKRLLVDLGAINVTVEHIEKALGHPFAQCTPAELTNLRAICNSIRDGNSTWAEYTKRSEPPVPSEPKTPTDEEKALQDGQAKLKEQQAQPKLKEEPKPVVSMTCKDACEKLNICESVKEVADVMNDTLKANFTPEETQTVKLTKDQAMVRLANAKRKK